MEELQSTEILDREILEDARKKAYRILKTADETAEAKAQAWDKKSRRALTALKERWDLRIKKTADEIMARLSLDKRRARSGVIEGLLKSAMDAWYESLPRERVLEILERELAKRLSLCPECSGGTGRVKVILHNLEPGEAEPLLKKRLPGVTAVFERVQTDDFYPELILDTGALRITASLSMVLDTLLHEKRAELIASLIGKALLEEGEGPPQGRIP
jgi:hypothetical protein